MEAEEYTRRRYKLSERLAAPLSGCPVAHLVPVELFTRRFRSVMCPLRRHAAGRAGLDGMGMGSVQKIHDGGSE